MYIAQPSNCSVGANREKTKDSGSNQVRNQRPITTIHQGEKGWGERERERELCCRKTRDDEDDEEE